MNAAERRQVIVQARETRLRAQRTCAETQKMRAFAKSIIRDLPGRRFVVTWATPEATVPAMIADMIRKKLDARTLPLNSPAKLWAGARKWSAVRRLRAPDSGLASRTVARLR